MASAHTPASDGYIQSVKRDYPALKHLWASMEAVGDTLMVDVVGGASIATAAVGAGTSRFAKDSNITIYTPLTAGSIYTPDYTTLKKSIMFLVTEGSPNGLQQYYDSATTFFHGSLNFNSSPTITYQITLAVGQSYVASANAATLSGNVITIGEADVESGVITLHLLDEAGNYYTGTDSIDSGFDGTLAGIDLFLQGAAVPPTFGSGILFFNDINPLPITQSAAQEMLTNFVSGNKVPYSGWRGIT
jgi:hypothetical protein